MILIANILSFVSTAVLIYSMFVKSKENMLLLQAGAYVLSTFSNTLVHSYAAACSNIVSIFRNAYLSQINSLVATIIFSIAYIVIGVLTNTLGIIGFLPVLACVEYTVWTYFAKTAQILRYGAIINLLLWLVHDIVIQLYGAVLSDVILIVITLISIIKYRHKD